MRCKRSSAIAIVIFVAISNICFLITMRQFESSEVFYNTPYASSTENLENSKRLSLQKEYVVAEEQASSKNQFNEKPTEPRRETSPPFKKKLPDTIVIGSSKCGTRAVLYYLMTHPGVAGTLNSNTPEVNYFSSNYEKGLEWYRNQMVPAKPGQMTIEKSPSYFMERSVPPRIYKFNHSVKLMLVVCDPVYRFVSQYLQNAETYQEKGRKYPSIEEVALDSDTGDVERSSSIMHGCFTDAMRRWLQYFPLKQIHIVDGDSLRENPLSEMTKVETYMGLEKYFTKDSFYFNETKGFYCAKENEMPKCMGSSKGRPHPKLRLSLEKKLRYFFNKCNKGFYEMIKQNQPYS